MKLLFVCSRNKKRSLTAEKIFNGRSGLDVKSAGTAASARIKLSQELLNWADHVLVMEKVHKNVIRENFPDFALQKIQVLGIPDDYEFMDEDLVLILEGYVSDMERR